MPRAAKTAKDLTQKQERFVVAYFKLGNASEAYRVAYSPGKALAKTVNEMASRLLKNRKIATRLTELRNRVSDKAVLTVGMVLAALARIVNADPSDFFDEHGNLRPLDTLSVDARAALSSIESFEEYQGRGDERESIGMVRKVKFWDKNPAIEKAMKYLGLFAADNEQKEDSVALMLKWINDRDAAAGNHGLSVKGR